MTTRLSLVTGAASGMGEAIARRLARRGDDVVLCDVDRDGLARLCRELGEDRARPLVLDVRDRPAVLREIRALGPLHTVVLAAGICRQARLDEEEDDATWYRVLDINLNGVYHVLKAAAPALVPGGRVIAISSGLGKLGRPGYEAYCASKHGVLGVVKCAAKELAPRGVTVNAVCPGWVDTPMSRGDVVKLAAIRGVDVARARAEIEASIPTGRMVSADEVAALVEFLASPDAGSLTGEALNISGGEFFA